MFQVLARNRSNIALVALFVIVTVLILVNIYERSPRCRVARKMDFGSSDTRHPLNTFPVAGPVLICEQQVPRWRKVVAGKFELSEFDVWRKQLANLPRQHFVITEADDVRSWSDSIYGHKGTVQLTPQLADVGDQLAFYSVQYKDTEYTLEANLESGCFELICIHPEVP